MLLSASRYKLHCCIIRYLALFLKGVAKDAVPGSLRVGVGMNAESANRLPRLNCPDPAPKSKFGQTRIFVLIPNTLKGKFVREVGVTR